MPENQPTHEASVDRRKETVVTQQPGYAASEQVTRDVAVERRRLRFVLITQRTWFILGLLEILLGLRFLLKLIAATSASGFAVFIYAVTKPFTAPFALLVGTPTFGGMILEVTTLIAIAVYALFFWVVVCAIRIAANRPIAPHGHTISARADAGQHRNRAYDTQHL